MQTRTLNPNQVGTLIVSKVNRATTAETKRERRKNFNDVIRVLKSLNILSHEDDIHSVALGVDNKGEPVVLVSGEFYKGRPATS